jgi:hypothetical protein
VNSALQNGYVGKSMVDIQKERLSFPVGQTNAPTSRQRLDPPRPGDLPPDAVFRQSPNS